MLNAATAAPSPPDFYVTARFNMVESQLRPNKITEPLLLAAMGQIPREAFVAEDQKSFAYSDEAISAGYGRKMLAPMVLARMIQELRIQPSDRVLDIGAATGYGAAILNEIAGETAALETDPNLLRELQKNRQAFGLEQVSAVYGALCDGFPPASPFQAILIEGAIQWLPEKITNQLAEGGRLVCVFYPPDFMAGQMGEARLFEKKNGVMHERSLFDAAAAVLPGFNTRPVFEL